MIDEKLIQNLIGLRDEVGILSFYAGFTPDQAADPQPRTPLEIKNGIRELRQRAKDEPHDRRQAIEQRLDALESTEVERLLDPKAHGRGRALFVAVSDGRRESVSLQVPFANRVILRDTAFVRPLVAAYDEGRPAGILVVNTSGARLLEWAVGEATELATDVFELTDAQTADIKSGPSPSNPKMHGSGNVNKDAYEDRIDQNRKRFLSSFLDRTVEVMHERDWDRLVVAGTPKIREEVRGLVPRENGRRILLADHTWEDAAPHEIAAQAWDTLRSVHLDREVELVEACKDRALSGGAGALGFRNVLQALNQGQVEHLLFQGDLTVTGYRTDEGTLHDRVGGPAAQAGFEMHEEPLLIERMVERVMEMGGRVTPVDDRAAALLGEHGGGVGALLRWS